jgi:hypothetical protein
MTQHHRTSCTCIYCPIDSGTYRKSYSETWILHSLNLHFPWFYKWCYWSCLNICKSYVKFNLDTHLCSLTQSLSYTFKLSVNWHSSLVLCTCKWKSVERKKDFQSQFPASYTGCMSHIVHSSNLAEPLCSDNIVERHKSMSVALLG